MTADSPSLGRFVLRIFLWLPPCFAAWYFIIARHEAAIAGKFAQLLIEQFASGTVSALEQSGVDLVFVTTLVVHPTPDQSAVLLPEVNPLLYTYGLALFLALMLASRATWWKILVGAAALVPFQGWGIAFDFLVQVGVRLGPEISTQAGLLGWRRDVIALGYQIGSLILPSLMPVVLWAAFCRSFIESMLSRKDFSTVLRTTG